MTPSLATAVELQVAKLGQPGAMAILRGDNVAFTEVDDMTRQMAWSMAKTMYAEPGVGLAAPQIGANVRMIVVDPEWAANPTGPQNPIFMLNPNITWKSEETEIGIEACLSVPGLQVPVERAQEIEVTYIDLDAEERTIACEGWEARIIQHELDHLNGKLLLDYLPRIRKELYLGKLRKQARMIKRAFKEAERAYRSELQKGRVERARSGDVSTEPVPSAEGSGASGDGSGSGTSEPGLEFNQPEGS